MVYLYKIISLFTGSRGEMKSLRALTICASLAALYAVSYSPVVSFQIVPGLIEIRFGFVVIAVAAMMFGPVAAVPVAVMGDFLGMVLFRGGFSFFWGFTLNWVLQGILFGLFFYKMKRSALRVSICMLINTVLINLILTTKWLEIMGRGQFAPLFAERLLHNVIMYPVNAVLLFFMLKSVSELSHRVLIGK